MPCQSEKPENAYENGREGTQRYFAATFASYMRARCKPCGKRRWTARRPFTERHFRNESPGRHAPSRVEGERLLIAGPNRQAKPLAALFLNPAGGFAE